MAPFVPTEEQLAIGAAVEAGEDVRVLAHAGTGKTKTLVEILRHERRAVPTLFLLYNRQLKERLREDVKGIAHVTAANYDSVLVDVYDPAAPARDFQLSLARVLQQDAPPLRPLLFERLVVDEAQDLDEAYLCFVHKLLRDNGAPRRAQLVSLGDGKQAIFGHRGADARFFAEDGPGRLHERPPRELQLSLVFRFGFWTADFVNRLCKPLFPDEKRWFADHSVRAEANLDRQVTRFVLPCGEEPTALINECVRLAGMHGSELTFLTGSRRETNRPLWRFVEQLNEQTGRRVGFEDCDEKGLLARIVTAHASKGESYPVVLLFLTNPRNWLRDEAGLHAELLYVALTRSSAQLVLVESADGLIFQEIALRAGAHLGHMPQARCAATGARLGTELAPAPRERPPRAAAADVEDLVQRLGYASKLALTAALGEGPDRPWSSEERPGLGPLSRAALWARHERERGEGGRLAGLLAALDRGEEAAAAYAALDAQPHRLTPRLRELLRSLPRPGEAWTWRQWLGAARLHPAFHFGHAAPARPRETEAELDAVASALRAACAGCEKARAQALGRPLALQGLYLAPGEVRYVSLESAQAERLQDRVLVAFACATYGVPRYSLVYVLEGKRVEGRLSPQELEGVTRLLRLELQR